MNVLAHLQFLRHISYLMASVWTLLVTRGGMNLFEERARRRRGMVTYIARVEN